jgi:tubulin-specific chaperone B
LRSPTNAKLLLAQIAKLNDDSKMLGFYGVESGMGIHVVDADPFSMSRGGGLEDVSLVKKYRMSEEDYDNVSTLMYKQVKHIAFANLTEKSALQAVL